MFSLVQMLLSFWLGKNILDFITLQNYLFYDNMIGSEIHWNNIYCIHLHIIFLVFSGLLLLYRRLKVNNSELLSE